MLFARFFLNILYCFYHKGLVKVVEDVLSQEHATRPNKPIYLVGDSFGGCLALAVAARNRQLDLVLILVNPGQQTFFIQFCSFVSKCILK